MGQILTAPKYIFGAFSIRKYITRKRKQFQRYIEARHTYEELSKLSDKELRDIGLYRGNIRAVAMGMFQDDKIH